MQRKTLRGGLFECQHFDVVVVHAKVAAVTFEMRIAQVVVEKSVVFEPCVLESCSGAKFSICLSTRKASCLSRIRIGRKSLTCTMKARTFWSRVDSALPVGDREPAAVLGSKTRSAVRRGHPGDCSGIRCRTLAIDRVCVSPSKSTT